MSPHYLRWVNAFPLQADSPIKHRASPAQASIALFIKEFEKTAERSAAACDVALRDTCSKK
ncbi:MAG: hypothetical protein J0I91_08425 [Candidatus Accumulibacter sp.]|nr:hypothetical protein [Accumulibacter sp.]